MAGHGVALIGAPTDIGAGTRGAGMGPEALRVAGLEQRLRALGLTVVDRGNLSGPPNPWLPPVRGYRHLAQVAAWNRATHAAVGEALAGGSMPVLLGGDHSLAVGSVSAVARHCRASGRRLRVLWLDAHADFNTRELTPSGNLHGMPLAILCGRGPAVLTRLGGRAPALLPAGPPACKRVVRDNAMHLDCPTVKAGKCLGSMQTASQPKPSKAYVCVRHAGRGDQIFGPAFASVAV